MSASTTHGTAAPALVEGARIDALQLQALANRLAYVELLLIGTQCPHIDESTRRDLIAGALCHVAQMAAFTQPWLVIAEPDAATHNTERRLS